MTEFSAKVRNCYFELFIKQENAFYSDVLKRFFILSCHFISFLNYFVVKRDLNKETKTLLEQKRSCRDCNDSNSYDIEY